MKRLPSVLLLLALMLMSVLLVGPAAWAQDTARDGVHADREVHHEVYPEQAAPLPAPEAISVGEAIGLVRDRLQPRDRSALEGHLLGGFERGGSFGLVTQQGAGNTARLDQAGPANLAVLSQQGDRNTTLLEQIGAGNIYGSWLTGDDNVTEVLQHGADNVYLLDFEGDGLQHRVVQQGTGNQAVQIGSGTAPFGIEQRGDHMQVVIRHGAAVH